MMRGSAIRNLIEAELAPGAIGNDEASIEQDIRARAATFFHPSGTCRMGSDPTAVVDPRLRVNGIQGLRVADASIMPAALNACTVAEVFRMMNDNNTVTRQFGMLMNRYDLLLAPTCAVRVPPANQARHRCRLSRRPAGDPLLRARPALHHL